MVMSAPAAKAMNESTMTLDNIASVEIIQVSGTRLGDLPIGAFSILSRDQIAQINPSSTIDLLARIPHVDVAQNGNAGGLSYVSIRGGEFNFTLVSIDGIVVNDSTNSRGGGFDFNQINPASIERIEVYRGGINSIYGADAISGVINIVTRDSTEPVFTLEVGTHKQINSSLTLSHDINEKFSLLGSVSSQKKEKSEFEGVNSEQFLVKGRYQELQLNVAGLLTYNQTYANGFTEDSGGELFASPYVSEQRESEQSLLGLTTEYTLNDKASVKAQLSWLKRSEDIANPGITEGLFSGIPASLITSNYERLELDLYSALTFNDKTQIILGGNHRRQDGNNRGTLDFGFPLPVNYDFIQSISSVYIEAQHQVSEWTLEGSARYDSPEDFDNEMSFRLGAAYTLNDKHELFAVFNQGYKLPSFFALAHPLVGNIELQPERSDNFEIGFLSQISTDLRYTISYYENKFEDLVDFDAALFTNVNRNRVDTSGVELDVTTKINDLISLDANIRYLEIQADAGVSLRKRPNISGNLRLNMALKQSVTALFVDFRDDYLDSSIATGYVRLPGYAVLGVSSTIELSRKIQLIFNLENVMRKRIENSVGFIQDEREARVGLIYSF